MEGCQRGGELFLAEERSAALQRSQDARDQLALRDAHHHAALLPLGIAVAEVPQKIRPAQLHSTSIRAHEIRMSVNRFPSAQTVLQSRSPHQQSSAAEFIQTSRWSHPNATAARYFSYHLLSPGLTNGESYT